MDYASLIRDVPDFPIEGILFKDITPLIGHGAGFRQVIDGLAERLRPYQADLVVGMESRGFIFACPLAYALGLGFVPVRTAGQAARASRSASSTSWSTGETASRCTRTRSRRASAS